MARAKPFEPTVFIHVVALDKQLSVHAAENKPLSKAIAEAFSFHKKTLPGSFVVRANDGEKISSSKTPAELGLEMGDLIYVREPAADRAVQRALAETAKAVRKASRRKGVKGGDEE